MDIVRMISRTDAKEPKTLLSFPVVQYFADAVIRLNDIAGGLPSGGVLVGGFDELAKAYDGITPNKVYRATTEASTRHSSSRHSLV